MRDLPIESAASLVASDEACYRWPGNDERSRELRAAYVAGATDYARFGMALLMTKPHLDGDDFKRRVVEIFDERLRLNMVEEAITSAMRKAIASGSMDASLRSRIGPIGWTAPGGGGGGRIGGGVGGEG